MWNLLGHSLAHFRIEAELGEGGMGVVYRAFDEKLRRPVALKVLPDSFAHDEDRRLRFLREARSAAAITHANIATVHDVGEAEGRLYIAMELVEGETLRARVEKGVSVTDAVSIAKDIARGLARAHEKGIVHRDLKPENVMITRHDEVKILDFGLAKLREDTAASLHALENARTAENITQQGRILGTPAYMSPEQARGESVDARTDVFALGIVLFEMLTGGRPFSGDTAIAVMLAASRDAPPRPSQKNPLVPPELDGVVLRCLAKARDERYADGREVLDAIQAQSPPSHASAVGSSRVAPGGPTPSLVTPVPSTLAPRRRWAWGLVGLASLGAAGLGLGHRLRATSAPVAAAAPAVSETRGKAVTDHPPPQTKSPEAAAAYAAAMQDLRDGSLTMSRNDLLRAIRLDPSFAAAHVQVVLHEMFAGEPVRRESFAVASQLRGSLDARGLLLLHAAEPLMPDPPDIGEVTVRLRALLEQFPDDAEALMYLGSALVRTGRLGEAEEVVQRALTVDPRFAGALWALAAVRMGQRDMDGELQVLDRCLQVSPAAASCLRQRAYVEAQLGHCAELESDARRMTVVEPDGARAYEFLAVAIASRGAPVDSVRTALEKWRALSITEEPSAADRTERLLELALSGLVGDLVRASAAARELERLAGDSTSEAAHAGPTLVRIKLLEEEGEAAEALRIAEEFERRVPAWIPDAPGRVRLWLAYARHHTGRLSEAEFRKEREALVKEALMRVMPQNVPLASVMLYGRYAETPDEVSDALSRATALRPEEFETVGDDEVLAQVGKLYLAAAKTEQALVFLRRAASACGIMPDFVDLEGGVTHRDRLRAHLWLGQALEVTGDRPGACETYGFILDRWKNPKPRSVTAEKAKERAKALGCAR